MEILVWGLEEFMEEKPPQLCTSPTDEEIHKICVSLIDQYKDQDLRFLVGKAMNKTFGTVNPKRFIDTFQILGVK